MRESIRKNLKDISELESLVEKSGGIEVPKELPLKIEERNEVLKKLSEKASDATNKKSVCLYKVKELKRSKDRELICRGTFIAVKE